MSSSPTLFGLIRRLFSGIWAIINGLYRLLVVLLLVLIVGGVWLAFRGGAAPTMQRNAALVIYPTGQLVDSIDVDSTQRFLEDLAGEMPTQTLLRDLIEALEQGAKDPRIPLAVLKLDSLSGAGLSQLQELAAAVRVFRAAGKPVFAYGPMFNQSDYMVAAQSDSVSLDPLGMVFVEGFGVYQNYFKDALDKLGVQVHVFRVGEYKSAVEPFERNDMSPEAREANREWLADLWQSYGREVAQGRKLPDASIANYTSGMASGLQKNGGDAAAFALENKLIDKVETLPQFRARIAETVGWDKDNGSFRQVHYSEYLDVLARERGLKPSPDGKIIALVVVQGEIVNGDSEPGMAGAETIADLLSSARQDEDVAAVVLRVDSPGGSVFGSEHIRREVQSLQADKKPVVVSMSNVAASGGYWIAMDADEIWAHDTTITGSIGIFALWPTFETPLKKLGIHTDGVGTTPLAGAFRLDRPLQPEVALVLQTQLERNYKQFIEAVASGRDLPLEKVSEIARGRVWSGSDALALGLVDQIGGLNAAIASAVRLAGLESDAYELQEFKQESAFPFQRFMDFMGSAGIQGMARQIAPIFISGPIETVTRSLRWLSDPRGIYAHCFCAPDTGGRPR